MINLISKPDSLIFDLDGTLWDNVHNYVTAWNVALEKQGYAISVNREDLLKLMDENTKHMLDVLTPDISVEKQNLLYDEVIVQYNKLIPTMKPIVYPLVVEGLKLLKTKYKLLLLSNCQKGRLSSFMNHTKTNHLFLDYLEHGKNYMPKGFSLNLLKNRNKLKRAVYIGDTDKDRRESTLANVPFVFVTYGFGETKHFNIQFHSFEELTEYFMYL